VSNIQKGSGTQNAISLEHDLFPATAALVGQIMDIVSSRTHRTVVECLGKNDPYRNSVDGGSVIPLPSASSISIVVPTSTVAPVIRTSELPLPTDASGPARNDAVAAQVFGISSLLWFFF
jgi:hypothetical protein